MPSSIFIIMYIHTCPLYMIGPRDSRKEERQTQDAETAPLIPKPTKRSHPFTVFLKAFNLFDEDFKQLSILGKIYEIVKVTLYKYW